LETKNTVNVSTELEYNDGLGDLLREKERLEFSWIKTSTVLIFLLAVIIATASFLLNTGKSILDSQSTQAIPLEDKLKSTPINKDEKPAVINKKISPETAQQQPIKNVKAKVSISSAKINKEPVPPIKKVKKIVPPTIKSSPYKFKIIAGSYKNKKYANQQVSNLKKNGFDGFVKPETLSNGSILYKVQAGAFKTNEAANTMKTKLKKIGVDSYISSN